MYNDEFIDGAPLLGTIEESCAYQLPSAIYKNLLAGKFKDLQAWVKNAPHNTRKWVFGICEDRHWMAVRIDWESKLIQYYDPMRDPRQKGLSDQAREKLRVSIVVTSAYYKTNSMYSQSEDGFTSWMAGSCHGAKGNL